MTNLQNFPGLPEDLSDATSDTDSDSELEWIMTTPTGSDNEEITQISLFRDLQSRKTREAADMAAFFAHSPPIRRPRVTRPGLPLQSSPKDKLITEKSFRCSAKKFFLTWPRTSGDPADLLALLLLYRKPVRKAIVAVESHKDGMQHIHVFVEYFKKIDIKNCNYFDKMFRRANGTYSHCNISSVKDLSATIRYITKGQNFVLYGLTQKMCDLIIDGTSIALAEVTAAVLEDPRIGDIAIRFPNKFVIHSKGLRELCEIQRQKLSFATTPYLWPPIDKGVLPWSDLLAKGEICDLYEWMRINFETHVQNKVVKPRKDLQLFLHGGTGTGKTAVLDFLRKHYRGFAISSFEDFYDRYNDYDYDFLYLDEFHGNKKIYWLNTLLAGEPMVIARKGSQYPRLVNCPVIICSNLTPTECYSKIQAYRPVVMEAFLARLEVVKLNYNSKSFDLIDMLEDLNAYEPLVDHVSGTDTDSDPEPPDVPEEELELIEFA